MLNVVVPTLGLAAAAHGWSDIQKRYALDSLHTGKLSALLPWSRCLRPGRTRVLPGFSSLKTLPTELTSLDDAVAIAKPGWVSPHFVVVLNLGRAALRNPQGYRDLARTAALASDFLFACGAPRHLTAIMLAGMMPAATIFAEPGPNSFDRFCNSLFNAVGERASINGRDPSPVHVAPLDAAALGSIGVPHLATEFFVDASSEGWEGELLSAARRHLAGMTLAINSPAYLPQALALRPDRIALNAPSGSPC